MLERETAIAEERTGMVALALFALSATDSAVALCDEGQVLLRSSRWHVLERDRTSWRATARDPIAPAAAPTLMHLAIVAAGALLRPGAPARCGGRYERPERGDVFDVRFERLEGRDAVGIAARDVTRLVLAERRANAAARTSPRPGGAEPPGGAPGDP